MKINTDGVLLGALADVPNPASILDIGTGTGVIALMLAQRYPGAMIDAVEIDLAAARAAKENFLHSPFSDRCTCYPVSFDRFFADHPGKNYDLIVSNPPFFINSLKSSVRSKEIARHTTMRFFADLLVAVKRFLNQNGCFSLILPVEIADIITIEGERNALYKVEEINIASFEYSAPHRKVLVFGNERNGAAISDMVIYSGPKIYSGQYRLLLKDFLTIF